MCTNFSVSHPAQYNPANDQHIAWLAGGGGCKQHTSMHSLHSCFCSLDSASPNSSQLQTAKVYWLHTRLTGSTPCSLQAYFAVKYLVIVAPHNIWMLEHHADIKLVANHLPMFGGLKLHHLDRHTASLPLSCTRMKSIYIAYFILLLVRPGGEGIS